MASVHGTCDERFHPVRATFEKNFEAQGEIGAAVAVELEGAPVVDLWGGMADPAAGRPWERDTLTLVMSTTKGVVAAAALLLWERGQLDIDAPVAEVWPEFGAQGKGEVTTRHLLSHQAGLPVFDQPVSVAECHDAVAVAERLAGQAPRWRPGAAHGYHVLTFGWLVGEVVRRVTGSSVGRYIADELCQPLGLDFHLGLPPDQEDRMSVLQPSSSDWSVPAPLDDKTAAIAAAVLDSTSLAFQALTNPPLLDLEVFNSPGLHQAEWPAAGGVTTARALAHLYGELSCDRVLSPPTLDAAERTQVAGPDLVLVVGTAFGLGFQLASELCAFAPDGGGFGHDGAGGSVAFADRRHGLGFAYVMNRMSLSLGYDRRGRDLVDAVYTCL